MPEDYGLYAVGTVVLMVLQSMNELGTSVAVVRWQGDVTRPARTATTLAYGSSFLLWASTFLLAPAVAIALNAPDATTAAAGPVVQRPHRCGVVDPQRAPDPRVPPGQRAVVDAARSRLSSAVSIALATRGWGAMSMACGALAGNVLCTTLICRLAPAFPRPGWNRTDAEELLRVGLPLAGTSLVFLVILNVDYIVVGQELDPSSSATTCSRSTSRAGRRTSCRSRSAGSPSPLSLDWPTTETHSTGPSPARSPCSARSACSSASSCRCSDPS